MAGGMFHPSSGRLGETVPPPATPATPAAQVDLNPRTCDGCKCSLSFPLPRFRCFCCPDFDLCVTCAPHHPQSHPLVNIRSWWHPHWDHLLDVTILVKDGQPCDFSSPPDPSILLDLRNRIDQILFNQQESMRTFIETHKKRAQTAQSTILPMQPSTNPAATNTNPPAPAPSFLKPTPSNPPPPPQPETETSIFKPAPQLFRPTPTDTTAASSFFFNANRALTSEQSPFTQRTGPFPVPGQATTRPAIQTRAPLFGMAHFTSGRVGQEVLQRPSSQQTGTNQ
uniref:Uncharacterized protein n=1 Tax=Chromera velia CCMP2878 TaxID=1169474 RepID=A0A0G4I786_9ALVE|eukprot:Cvel_11628.t1-p1 / transcript=Cvel_11628.t1 / gene=Cvel_11628 / organism=Chromera_velia_CCMP2878 / gene_product=hypothetical protein / transcript_product=hypothetical protein / location=Cvel_scaffold736:54504-55346(-) / protein_length=281 / sequence_SO=supercontig / SO=protein_coding / is_pseudo=false